LTSIKTLVERATKTGTMGKINAEWHRANVMPKNQTDKQRAEWHYQHALHCGCREISESIARLLKVNGYTVPAPQPLREPRAD